MGNSFADKVDAYFVKGAKEHAPELNIMYVQAAKQKAELEKLSAEGPKITVEEIVVDATTKELGNPSEPETEKKEEDFVL